MPKVNGYPPDGLAATTRPTATTQATSGPTALTPPPRRAGATIPGSTRTVRRIMAAVAALALFLLIMAPLAIPGP